MNESTLWEAIKKPLKEHIGASAFETWFEALNVQEQAGELIIETPDDFFKNWILDHYIDALQDLSSKEAPNTTITISVNTSLTPEPTQQAPAPRQEDNRGGSTSTAQQRLNARFSFDNFVIGPSNRFAFAACQAVAESPAKSYNPLFLYSQVGLGKTHLMQSVAQEIKKRHPHLKYTYLSSEMFTNELISAIQHRSTAQFREKYRNIDVLLIDDIQFIAGKESTQEEFFHTFNALHNSHKQIIISSDRPPREIANLEERLTSRFAWGLVADIQPPDFETRVAILKKKLEREPVSVPDDVITFIASEIKTNIRELEGALIRVVAYSLLEERPVSLEIAKSVLKDMVKETLKIINVGLIQKTVADFYDLSVTELKSKRRSKNIIIPRQICMYLTRQLTALSLPEIGAAFGGKDHTTVLHSYKKIETVLKTDKEMNTIIEKLLTKIKD